MFYHLVDPSIMNPDVCDSIMQSFLSEPVEVKHFSSIFGTFFGPSPEITKEVNV